MIFLDYIETCGLLLDYPRVGAENIKDFRKKSLGISCMQILMYTEEDYFLFPIRWNKVHLKNLNYIVQT